VDLVVQVIKDAKDENVENSGNKEKWKVAAGITANVIGVVLLIYPVVRYGF